MSLTEVLDGGVDGVAAVKEAADEPGANEAAGARHAEEAAAVPGCRHFVAPALVDWPARLPLLNSHGITGVAVEPKARAGTWKETEQRSAFWCLARLAAPRPASTSNSCHTDVSYCEKKSCYSSMETSQQARLYPRLKVLSLAGLSDFFPLREVIYL